MIIFLFVMTVVYEALSLCNSGKDNMCDWELYGYIFGCEIYFAWYTVC